MFPRQLFGYTTLPFFFTTTAAPAGLFPTAFKQRQMTLSFSSSFSPSANEVLKDQIYIGK
jgi:hypothetical protein